MKKPFDTPRSKTSLSKTEKIGKIESLFVEVMETMGLDLEDDSLKETPGRIARMYINDLFSGLDESSKPRLVSFENSYKYNKMLVEKNITFHSACEHHFMPIIGKAHVGYISSGKVIGISKINRLVDYYARRPQVQERLALQVANNLMEVLETEDVIVVMEAIHTCLTTRGAKDKSSSTVTLEYGGRFEQPELRREFMDIVTNDLR